MAEVYLPKGSDKQFTVSVTGASGVLDLSAYEGYALITFYEHDRTIIQKYSKNTVSGYNSDDIDTSDEDNGNIIIDFQRALSEAGRVEGRVMGQFILQSTDADYASSQKREYSDEFYILTIDAAALETTVDLEP
jgi:hypothetical protein